MKNWDIWPKNGKIWIFPKNGAKSQILSFLPILVKIRPKLTILEGTFNAPLVLWGCFEHLLRLGLRRELKRTETKKST